MRKKRKEKKKPSKQEREAIKPGTWIQMKHKHAIPREEFHENQ